MDKERMIQLAKDQANTFGDFNHDGGYHNKRKTNRRQEDGKFEFLMTQVKLSIRLLDKEPAKYVLMDAVDTIEKGEKI